MKVFGPHLLAIAAALLGARVVADDDGYPSCGVSAANKYYNCVELRTEASCNAESKCTWCTGIAVGGVIDDLSESMCMVELNEPCDLQGEVIGYGCPTPTPSITFEPTPAPKPTSTEESCTVDILDSVNTCADASGKSACESASPKAGSCNWCASDCVCTLSVFNNHGCKFEPPMLGSEITYGTGCDSDYITTCGVTETVTVSTCAQETDEESCSGASSDCVWCDSASATDLTGNEEADNVGNLTASACMSTVKSCMISGETVGGGCVWDGANSASESDCSEEDHDHDHDHDDDDDEEEEDDPTMIIVVVVAAAVLLIAGGCFMMNSKKNSAVTPK